MPKTALKDSWKPVSKRLFGFIINRKNAAADKELKILALRCSNSLKI
jgi:hypothetical protein